MIANYELKIEKFAGPIEKLLELIEAKHLDITELSLAEVTADFLNYFKMLTNADKMETNGEKLSASSGILADFVVVASRLLLIKSKALLPVLEISEEEEKEIKDLEERLKLYKEFKAARESIKKLWNEKPLVFSREFLAFQQPFFYPPKDLDVSRLNSAISGLLNDLNQFILETKNIKISIISLEEKMNEMLERVKTSVLKFKDLVRDKSRSEIVALFLAVLHLLKNELVKVEQEDHFAEISISKL